MGLTAQLVLASPSAIAAQPPKPGQNAWIAHGFVNMVFNFRFSNGDVVTIKQGQHFARHTIVQVQRYGHTKPSEMVANDLRNVRQFGGPSQLFNEPDTRLTENYNPVMMSDAPGKINLMYVRGDNGILVIGQINQVFPALYFTYLIPSETLSELPIAQVSYLLPDDGEKAYGMTKHLDVGLRLGFKDGRTISKTLRVPTDVTLDAPVTAVARPAKPADAPYEAIAFDKSSFAVPAELQKEVAASAHYQDNSAGLVGVDRYRAASKRADSILEKLKSRIFGQDAALEKLVYHYRKMVSMKMKKPRVLVAMGPSGVGKTYTAEELADAVSNGDKSRVMTIAGNEYNEHAGSLKGDRLFGSPKGVKDAQEGALIKWLQGLNGELGVLVINEGDKMHPDMWIKFMELFDKGMITAGDGSIITHPNLLIMITSNRGATEMFPSSIAEWTQSEIDKRNASFTKDQLKKYFTTQLGLKDEKNLPREVMNRIDDFIPYGPFSKEAAIFVAKVAAEDVAREFQRDYLVKIDFDEKALEHMALAGWSAADDARQIREQVGNAALDALDTAVHTLGVKNHGTIKLTYDTSDIRHPVYRVSVDGESATIDGRSIISNNPLKNEELKRQLLGLEIEMNKQVIGQEWTIKHIADAVISHAMRTKKTRPLVIGLLGVSGNGKTESARALARIRFGGHFGLMSMGDIGDEHQFGKKFGVGAEYQGGDMPKEFEKILRANPDGGVIVFDEISNMGGANPDVRAALLMQLYGLFEEGKFISPVDGREYDLSKYIFILTGNEGEKLFGNSTADDMLKSTWEENRSPDKVREQLNSARFPNAFINRVKWFLMKPLMSYEVHTVTKKLWDREVRDLEDENKGLSITTGDNFIDRVSAAYFASDKGGRAVRDILEDKVANLVLRVLAQSEIDTHDLRGVEIKFDLIDNRLSTPFRTGHSPKREVAFHATVIKNGEVKAKLAINATDLVADQVLLGKDSAMAVSYHEMGHAAFDGLSPAMLKMLGYNAGRLSEITGMELQYVTIRGGRSGELKYYGYARSSPIEGAMLNPTHDRVVLQIAQLWAGSIAQQMAGYPADAGWSNDLEKIRKLATNYFTTWGLDREFVGIPVDKDGKPVVSLAKQDKFNEKYDALLAEAEDLAKKVVRLRWDFIGSASMELMKRGEISKDRIAEIDEKVSAMKALGKRVPTPRRTPLEIRERTAGAYQQPMTCEDVFR